MIRKIKLGEAPPLGLSVRKYPNFTDYILRFNFPIPFIKKELWSDDYYYKEYGKVGIKFQICLSFPLLTPQGGFTFKYIFYVRKIMTSKSKKEEWDVNDT